MPDSGAFKKAQQVVNPEARFIERLKKGEPSALSEVVHKYGPKIYKYLFRCLGDRKQADEGLEAIMAAFVKTIPELGESDKLEAAIWREAHKTAVKMAFGGKGPSAPRAGAKKVYPPPAYLTECSEPSVKKFISAWEELDPPYREALALSGIEPLLGYDEASGVIEGTQGTLRSRMTYALRRLIKEV